MPLQCVSCVAVLSTIVAEVRHHTLEVLGLDVVDDVDPATRVGEHPTNGAEYPGGGRVLDRELHQVLHGQL